MSTLQNRKLLFSQLFILVLLFLTVITASAQNMNFGAGSLFSNIDGDTVTIGLNTSQTPDYFDAMGGNADKGLIRIVWDKIKSPSEIKPLSVELSGFSDQKNSIDVLWADFLTNTPYVIKSGRLTVSSNDGNTITGTLEITAELGGSSLIGELLKGKKQTIMRDGQFEIKY